MAILPKIMCIFNTILTQISMTFFTRLEKNNNSNIDIDKDSQGNPQQDEQC